MAANLLARWNVFAATLGRLIGPTAGNRGAAPARTRPDRFATPPPAGSPDPVSVAIFAIDRVGPAAVRACATGTGVRISARDEATAAVIRAALSETSRGRLTDRLIEVVTD